MKAFEAKHYLLEMRLRREKVPGFEAYPFSLPAVRHFESLTFHPAVTFLIGENGSGKSTLLEALAIAAGFNPEGGSQHFNFATRESHAELHQCMALTRGPHRHQDGFFMRAESFYNVASAVDSYGVIGSYGGRSLHHQSHGESFFALLLHRFRGKGLYILDEPEAALSPTRQMAMLSRMHDLVKDRSQFIIATHSPILLAYPHASIYQVSATGLQPIDYAQTEPFTITRDFLNNPARALKVLLED